MSREIFRSVRLLRAPSSLTLNVSRDGGIHHLSGQLVLVFYHPHYKSFLPFIKFLLYFLIKSTLLQFKIATPWSIATSPAKKSVPVLLVVLKVLKIPSQTWFCKLCTSQLFFFYKTACLSFLPILFKNMHGIKVSLSQKYFSLSFHCLPLFEKSFENLRWKISITEILGKHLQYFSQYKILWGVSKPKM